MGGFFLNARAALGTSWSAIWQLTDRWGDDANGIDHIPAGSRLDTGKTLWRETGSEQLSAAVPEHQDPIMHKH